MKHSLSAKPQNKKKETPGKIWHTFFDLLLVCWLVGRLTPLETFLLPGAACSLIWMEGTYKDKRKASWFAVIYFKASKNCLKLMNELYFIMNYGLFYCIFCSERRLLISGSDRLKESIL